MYKQMYVYNEYYVCVDEYMYVCGFYLIKVLKNILSVNVCMLIIYVCMYVYAEMYLPEA